MELLKKTFVIASYIGLLGWILFVTFQTKSLPNDSLIFNYIVIAVFAIFLFKIDKEHSGNA
ncbi:MAG: hypothetical protein KC478_13135 [Bacteriovoracaceae bacterium]|nr:hypothetical protein [Bacteriovoracaceae bacterium]